MAKYFSFFLFFFIGTILIGTQGDELDDILGSSVGSTLDELEALTRLTGAPNPYRKSYTPLPFRNYDRGLNFMGGSTHVHNVPDLINLVFGLGGHIVGRAGWIVHDAFKSLFDGMFTSHFKLRSPAAHNAFGHGRGDDIFDDGDLLGGIAGDLFGGLDFNF